MANDFQLRPVLALDLPGEIDPRAEARIAQSFDGRLAGIDEAGRGPWAGPVSVAAVILDYDNLPEGIRDSKTLNEAGRVRAFEAILKTAEVSIALASPESIDRLNIRAATLGAMTRAATALPRAPRACLIDGRDVPPDLAFPGQSAIKGDGRLLCVAAASIVAKVTRDRLMTRMDAVWPGYGFARHKGYGTAAHSAALGKLGPCPLHRRSFRPIRAVLGLDQD
ncbi:ribonuclease HII [Stappia indica]|uniref:ribonuclease HII n=1 Tax=Stappia indica TaxID=538381 RepID=UPI001CD523F7|nr:ribonuclease HII [Stappia indica]MCA1297806.1 ribonuclease HII [Stappia indica]